MRTVFTIFLILLVSTRGLTQVEISFDGHDTDVSSILDLQSVSSGLLVPRLTTPLREAISSPGRALLVFDLTDSMFYFHDAGEWHSLNEMVRVPGSNEVTLKNRNLSVAGNVAASGKLSTGNLNVNGYSSNALVPTGAIFMWSGSIASIPTGWALCDGSGGTPDLRERFIVGAGIGDNLGVVGTTAYLPNDEDGLNSVTLTSAQTGLPSHPHSISDPKHTHSINNGSGFATWINNEADAGSGSSGYEVSASVHPNNVDSKTTDVTINNVTSANAIQSHENRPPYFALAYIIKLP